MSILKATDLKKYYGTEPNITRALDGVTFSVEEGEFVAVVGTSGSGKSTLLHMMGGLDTPTSGSVVVRDKDCLLYTSESASFHLTSLNLQSGFLSDVKYLIVKIANLLFLWQYSFGLSA